MLVSFIILLLKERPMHGYAMMNSIKKKTKVWKPSPGTIYPLLTSLQKDGLVSKKIVDRKNVYILTAKGSRMANKVLKIKSVFKKRMLETLSSMITENELANLHKKMVSSHFSGESKELIKELNKLWSFVVLNYSKPSKRVREATLILKDARKRLIKLK